MPGRRHARQQAAGALRLALLAASCLAAGDAAAAVRICQPSVSSGPVIGTTEKAARATALALWKSKALTHGEPFASWRIAADKVLKCLPREGGFQCLAVARPCTIEQAPGRRENRQKRIGI